MHLYDIAEDDIKNDKLGYQNYVDELFQLIKQTFEDKKSLNIGVVGSWGDGKTTAINMCLAKLKKSFIWHKELKNWIYLFLILGFTIYALSFYSSELHHFLILLKINIIAQVIQQHIMHWLFAIVLMIIIFHKTFFDVFKKIFHFIGRIFCTLFFKNDYIEIWFSPWSCSDEKHIMSEYLKAIAESFSPDFNSVSNLLLKYSKLIIGEDLSGFANWIDPSSNLSELKIKIENKLKNSNKRIVIIIDDFDRIHCNEVYNVLKLIGTVANFPNVVNILAYDREYIIEELKNCISPNSKVKSQKKIIKADSKEEITEIQSLGDENKASKYLEKIITIENPLPKIEDIDLKNYFFKHLEQIIEVEK